MRTRRGRGPLLTAALLLAVLLPACATRGGPAPDAAAQSTVTAAPPADPNEGSAPRDRGGEDPGSAGAGPDGAVGPDDSAADRTARQADPTMPPHNRNDFVRLRVDKPCVHPGQTLTVAVTTAPNATLSLVISYSDGQAHGAVLITVADDRGRFDWTVPVALDVPPGDAVALASAGDGDRSGSADAPFTVASPNGC